MSFGAGAAAELLAKSAGVAWAVTELLTVPDDQGEGVHERQRRATAVEQFLERNFSLDEISKNPDLRRQAEKLLFETKPAIVDLGPSEEMGEGAGMGSRAAAE